MKPLKLTMQSFGSYGKKTEISFENTNQNLFLITGDTGAGKTTIFDAIVFALYGEASSSANKKEGAILQSQYTNYDCEPYVELTFYDGGTDSVYTVKRVPKHIRIKKRGTGTKIENGSVSLIMPDNTEYPSKETNEKLIEIVGLTKEQFMQVAMIAQGEFMEMLRAKSDDKKEIFRKLFSTGIYRKIIEELAGRKKEKEREIEKIKTECITVAKTVTVPQQYAYNEELTVLKENLSNGDISQIDEFLSCLKKLCNELDSHCAAAKKEKESADKQRDEAMTTLTEARHLSEHFDKIEEAEKVIAKYNKKKEAIQKTVILIDEIRSSYEIKPKYEAYTESQRAVQSDEKELSEKKNVMPDLVLDAEKSEQERQNANDSYHSSLEQYSKTAERVQKALESFEKINNADKEIKTKEKLLKQEEKKLLQKREELHILESEESEKKNQSAQLSDLPKLTAEWEAKKNLLEQSADEAEKLIVLENELNTLNNKINRLDSRFSAEQTNYQQKHSEYENMQKNFLDNQKGMIVKSLVEGQPCPICGSVHHPSPYVVSDSCTDITKEKLDIVRKDVEKMRDKKEKTFSELSSYTATVSEKQKHFDERFDKLKNDISENSDTVKAADIQKIISEKQQLIIAEGKKLKEKNQQLEQINEFLRNVDDRKNHLRTEIDVLNQDVQEASNALERSRAERNSLSSSFDYENAESARMALKKAQTDKNEKQSKLKCAEQSANDARIRKERTAEIISRLERDLPQKREKSDSFKNAYETILKEKNLSETKWLGITDKYELSKADFYQNKVNQYETDNAIAKNILAEEKKAVGEESRPIIAEFEKAVEDANAFRTAAEKTYEEYKQTYQTNQNAHNLLFPKIDDRKKIVTEHSKLDFLYKALSGNISGSRMDLETFVQRYYLERILQSANRRFLDMSAGQFELCMYDIDKAGDGKNRGLDLMVYSTVTGKKREVRTLSGGESFMAALSLALGLADRIQENSAALSLDVMFIDEGFGSLDDNSRNQAVRVLREMAEGSRLIGIISHVTELKQEIDNQLIVTKTEHGSQAKWQK